ncbi:isoprenoid synthase domain-containing protein [Phaeosphaeriaceae sp. PMI808]|nr:isoprenoid synthase domain-containing protein [Phaeosphaeriaceae sp. PMI808]
MPTTLQEFESVWPRIRTDIQDHCKQYKLPQQSLDWFTKSLDYNVVGGKCNRGMSVIDTTSILQNKTLDPASEEYFRPALLGWCIELLQAFFLVSDDIMDSSKTRRGNPCWYLAPKVSMIAINDAFMLEGSIYVLLKKHLRQEKSYVDILDLFHEVTFQTECGQICDLLTAPEDEVNLDNFSLDKFSFIVIYKTAYYSFYLPVALALYYIGAATEKNLKTAHDILIPMGEYFQAQDDFLDAFADPEVLGKVGTDIQDNKCSWIVNQALKKVNPEQRKLLEENYGQKDAQKEAKVKELYHELKLQQFYEQWEEERVADLRSKIDGVDESDGLKKEIFEVFLKKIYKRSK